MPIEIRELVIEASLKPEGGGNEEAGSRLLTESDMDKIKNEVFADLSGRDDLLTDSLKRSLIEECLLAVRAMMDEANRR